MEIKDSANIYAHPQSVFIDRNVTGCVTLGRAVKKVVYGRPHNEEKPRIIPEEKEG